MKMGYYNTDGLVISIIPIFMIDLNRKSTIKKNDLIEKSAKKIDLLIDR